MKYSIIPSPVLLSDYVRYFWALEGEAAKDYPYVYRSMADGSAELIFHYQGVFNEIHSETCTSTSIISGLATQSQQVRRFSISQNFGMFGVYLYPFAVSELFSIQGEDLKNQMLDLKTILGWQADEMEEKMLLATNNGQRAEIMSAFFQKRIQKATHKHTDLYQAIRSIIHSMGQVNVEALADDYSLSTRQFERNFKQVSGFSPKLFSRIIRFQNALAQYNDKDKSLTQIAYECGYYDQSHFILDFKEFSGHNPREYFLNHAEGTEWRRE